MSRDPSMARSLSIVGPGRVGSTLGRLLAGIGWRIDVLHGRDPDRTAAAVAFVGAGRPGSIDDCLASDVVLVAVPDRSIAGVAEAVASVLASALSSESGRSPVVFHTSGSASSRLLEPAAAAGARVASAHPLQSFASAEEAIHRLDGVFWALEGDPDALAVLRPAIVDLGGRPVDIETDGKPLYHGAASVASNFLVALLDLALSMAAAAGLSREDAWSALRPLIDGTLDNVGRLGPTDALTGPIQRGDASTVAAHLDGIAARLAGDGDHEADAAALYRALGRATLAIARARGLDDESAAVIARLLVPDDPA